MSQVSSSVTPTVRPLNLLLLLQINVGTLVILGTSLLAMGQQNIVYALIAAVATATAIIVTDIKGYFRLGPDATTLAALAACVVLVVQLIRNAEQSQLLNVANILIYLEIILLFQEKRDRTYWSLMALSLLQVIVAAALNLGLMFGLLLIVYVLASGTALMLFFAVRETRPFLSPEERESSTGLAGEVPEAANFVGSITAAAGAEMINRSLIRRLVRMIGLTAIATVIIFFAIPRYDTTVWQGAQQSQVATVGFTEEVRLDDIGRILESPEQVMRVEFTDLQGRPYQVDGEPYFRGTVLSEYRENGLWTQVRYGNTGRPLERQTSFDLASTIIQRITLQPGSHSVLFNISPCHFVEGSPADLNLNLHTRQLTLNDEDEEPRGSFRYKLGTTAFRNGWQRDLIPALLPSDRIAFQNTDQEWVRRHQPALVAVAEQVIADQSLQQANAFERSKALENHFRRSGIYNYSLEINQNRDRNVDPIEDFVRNHRTGHCEYFAGALTLMLRSQGIQARMVVGYKGGEFNTVGNYYIVRQLHAHAWVEAYLRDEEIPADERDTPEPMNEGCWLRLDPTPEVIDVAEMGEGFAIITKARELADYCQVLWDDYVLGLNSTRQQQAIYGPIMRSLQSLQQSLFGRQAWKERVQRGRQLVSRLLAHRTLGVPNLMWLCLGAVLTIGGLYRWRHRWRQLGRFLGSRLHLARHGRTRPYAQLDVYRRFERSLARVGLVRAPTQTASEFAGAVEHWLWQRDPGHMAQDVPQRVTDAYYRFRFGHQPLTDEEHRRLLQDVARLELAIASPSRT